MLCKMASSSKTVTLLLLAAGVICCSSAQVPKVIEGFSCPEINKHPLYYHPTDCRHFFSCFNFREPHKIACYIGLVYDAEDYACKTPKEVAECSCWYDCAAKANSSCPMGPCNADCSCRSDSTDGEDDDYENLDARADSVQE